MPIPQHIGDRGGYIIHHPPHIPEPELFRNMSKHYKIETRLFIDGKFVDSHSGKTFTISNPATEEVVAQVAEADEHDVDIAVAAAKKAFPAWSASPAQYKRSLLKKFSKLIERDAEELGYLEAVSMGRYNFSPAWANLDPLGLLPHLTPRSRRVGSTIMLG